MDTPKFDAWRIAERRAFAAEQRCREAKAGAPTAGRHSAAFWDHAARELRAVADAMILEAMAELQACVEERLTEREHLKAPFPLPESHRFSLSARRRPRAGPGPLG